MTVFDSNVGGYSRKTLASIPCSFPSDVVAELSDFHYTKSVEPRPTQHGPWPSVAMWTRWGPIFFW